MSDVSPLCCRYVTTETSNEPLSRAEIEVMVGEYSLSMLEPPSDRHPEYTRLVTFALREDGERTAEGEGEPMLHATFIKRPRRPRAGLSPEAREKLGYYAKELQLVFHNCIVVFDADLWERLYCFFFRCAFPRLALVLALALTRHVLQRHQGAQV